MKKFLSKAGWSSVKPKWEVNLGLRFKSKSMQFAAKNYTNLKNFVSGVFLLPDKELTFVYEVSSCYASKPDLMSRF